ncbi:MAG: LLM class flavin-dependent oxidoreductase [Promethearchaeota archaeon]
MKFGSLLLLSRKYERIKSYVLRLEELGYDSVHAPDHFIGQQYVEEPWLEAISIISALAEATSTIKLSFGVLCNSFRNPAYLAKIISTLDHISNGRMLMWVGAGWNKREYRQYGYPFPKGHVRVSQLEEALTIFKKMFTEDKATFEGKFYTLKKTLNNPKPIQKPYPQLVLGTTGLRMTDIACREADGINIPFMFNLADVPDRISLIKENLKKYNRDPSEFEISILYPVVIVKTQEELEKFSERQRENAFIGFPEDIKERFATLEHLGLNKLLTVAVTSPDFDDPLKVFAEKVM